MVDVKFSGDDVEFRKIVKDLKDSGVNIIIVVVGGEVDYGSFKNVFFYFDNLVNIFID